MLNYSELRSQIVRVVPPSFEPSDDARYHPNKVPSVLPSRIVYTNRQADPPSHGDVAMEHSGGALVATTV